MSGGIIYKESPARCEFDFNLHFTAYEEEEKTFIDITAPDLFLKKEELTTDIITAVLTAMAKNGIGEGAKNLRKMGDYEEEVEK